MKLSEYKKRNRYSIQDLADRFKTPFNTMYTWIRSDSVFIRGREGQKVIYRETVKELAKEEGK